METPPQTSHESGSPAGGRLLSVGGENHRRGFLAQAITLVGGTVALLVPAVVGIVAFLDPLRQKSGGGRFVKLTSLDVLPEDGTPQRFPIIAERTDAWNRFPNEPIGAVFLRRTGPNTVEAFNVDCPHAGCPIQYHGEDEKDEQKRNRFACPCHKAVFELTGERIAGVPSDSPRDLDKLVVDPDRLRDGEVWVRFQNFQTGKAKKVAKA